MTPRMVELSRRLSDIEFKELAALPSTPPVIEEEEEDENRGGGLRLRERLRVPASSPSRLDGLELVEPAKVDGLYREDIETSAYLQRRQRRSGRESLDTGTILGSGRVLENERRRLVALTRRIHEDWEQVSLSMRELRLCVAMNGGLPLYEGDEKLRSTLWLAMLEVRQVPPEGYAQALRRCPSPSADKINNDAFRTLAADAEFRAHVTTASIVRVLNALLSAPDRSASDPPRYVQGMNTLAAPFLYVMGEGASFYAFRQFLRRECPLYARPSLPGVHACVQLVDECLAFADPPLFSHLRRHGAVAKIYAFPAAMTLSASVGPLRQVIRLWDFLLAFGVHLNVVCIVAQLLSMRELLITTQSPMAFLRSWPPLRAESVIRRTREIYDILPLALRMRIKMHAHDPELAESLASAAQVPDPMEPMSLKRDLPLSPTEPAGWDSSVDVSRPRARTFSGMLNKRMRTVEQPIRNVPSYGALGLGLRTAPPALGGGPRGMPVTRARQRRLAGGEWMLDRKLSTEYK
ncbi:CDC16 protein [Coemansia sp. RSA 2337]|nr:CDC16 protein [Coemansia sp. S155-1]KAJ2114236.1 CDC16 protein [Coemansia sp. RSA 922]KAJ2444249.1 CDC16 protein [Coemansia sp. RSA 2337]